MLLKRWPSDMADANGEERQCRTERTRVCLMLHTQNAVFGIQICPEPNAVIKRNADKFSEQKKERRNKLGQTNKAVADQKKNKDFSW